MLRKERTELARFSKKQFAQSGQSKPLSKVISTFLEIRY